MAEKPTTEQLLDEEGLKSVHREADDSWRHGSYVWEVFHRKGDNTYWGAAYCLSSDGETNELREGLADLKQVWPVQVTKTEYTAKEPTQ